MDEKKLLLLGFPTIIFDQFIKAGRGCGIIISNNPAQSYDAAILWKNNSRSLDENAPVFYMGCAHNNRISFERETPIYQVLSTIQKILYPSLVVKKNSLYSPDGSKKDNQHPG